MGAKKRVDALLVERGLVETGEKARALILAGKVWSLQTRIEKAGERLAVDSELHVQKPACPYVGRGGVKLAAAIEHFKMEVDGRVCLDVGASTGGFSDCLLQHGASQVMALDVGKGQLDWKLSQEPRILRLEGINARYLQPEQLPLAPGCVTLDVSFISQNQVLPAVLSAVAAKDPRAGMHLMALVKPQFEAPRNEVGPGGIVSDPATQRAAVEKVCHTVAALGWRVLGTVESSLPGVEGNREFFIYAGNDR